MITIRKYRVQDIVPAMEIWNEVVRDGIAFPQDEELTEQEIKTAIRNTTIANKMVPVCCGSAYKNKGVQLLLDAIVDFMPSPLDVAAITGEVPKTGKEEERPADDKGPFSALAFKVMADPYVGKLVFFRVYSGTMDSGSYYCTNLCCAMFRFIFR